MRTKLNAESGGVFGLILVILLGIAYIWLIFPQGFVAGKSSFWLAQTEDVTLYMSGFNAYFFEPWRFPLLKIESINYPIGTRATFVDIIPIYSFLLKLIVPHSFFPFNPFGYWIALSYVMSSISGWFILRSLKIRSWIALFTLSCFLLLFPALNERLAHISLTSHWLALFGFALYARSAYKPIQTIEWSVLLFAAFYINVYIFVMTFTIFAVTMLKTLTLQTPKGALTQFCIPPILITLSLFVTLLPLPLASIAQGDGWGAYSMNLLSPISGGAFIKLKNAEMPQQYEGFNYLGLGVIILFFYAINLRNKFDSNFYRRNIYLLLLLASFFIYSLSYKVYFGQVNICEINYSHYLNPFFYQFRCSGRFFWPVGYAITIFAVITVALYNKKRGAIILLSCLALQILDLNERTHLLIYKANLDYAKPINMQIWEKKLKGETALYFYPKYLCAQHSSAHSYLLPTMLLASQNAQEINTGYIARYSSICDDVSEEIKKSDFNKSAYIFVKDEYPPKEIVETFFPKDANITCDNLDFAFVCKQTSVTQKHIAKLDVTQNGFASAVGALSGSKIISLKKSGYLLYGPYIYMASGKYKISVFGKAKNANKAFFDVVSNDGQKSYGSTPIKNNNVNIADLNVSFTKDAPHTEFRIFTDNISNIEVKYIEIERLD